MNTARVPDFHKEVELHQHTFALPIWRRLRMQSPFLYDECRALWLTCLELWGRRYRLDAEWNGIVTRNWLRRAIDDCVPALNALVKAGIIQETKDGELSMPYFPKERRRSNITRTLMWKIDLTKYTPLITDDEP